MRTARSLRLPAVGCIPACSAPTNWRRALRTGRVGVPVARPSPLEPALRSVRWRGRAALSPLGTSDHGWGEGGGWGGRVGRQASLGHASRLSGGRGWARTCCRTVPGRAPPASTPSHAFVGRELCSFVIAHLLEQLCNAGTAHPSPWLPPLPSPVHLQPLPPFCGLKLACWLGPDGNRLWRGLGHPQTAPSPEELSWACGLSSVAHFPSEPWPCGPN